MTRTTVLIHHPRARDYAERTVRRFPNVDLRCSGPDHAVPDADWAQADILLVSSLPLPPVPDAPRLRLVQLTSAGIDNLLPLRDRLKGVAVANARGVSGPLMTDYAMMTLTMLHWDMPGVMRNQAARLWQLRPVEPLAGRTLGLLGVGAIGTAIAARARAAGMTVLGLKRDPSTGAEGLDRVFGPRDLPAFLPLCDFLVLAVPATAETRGMIGARELGLMRPDAVLVNMARGDVVDEAALIEALVAGRIRGAALDVFGEEPLPATSPLWGMPNVIVTPHMAGAVSDYIDRVFAIFADNVDRFLAGRPARNLVNLDRGY